MIAVSLGFLLGVCLYQLQAVQPAPVWSWLLLPLLAAVLSVPRLRPFAATGLGFLWTLAWLAVLGPQGYDPAWDRKDLIAEGVVASLPEQRGADLRLVLAVDGLRSGGDALPPPGRVRLSWRAPTAIPTLGERWQLALRLKPPNGFSNPGGFDYEAWLFRQGLAATGYVTDAPFNRWLSSPRGPWRLAAARQALRDRLLVTQPVTAANATVVALTVGDRSAFDATLWDVLRRTGTTHLMSISGLHVSMIAGLAYAVVARLWRRSGRLPLVWPAQHAAAWAGILAAAVYAGLAGLALPTVRSLLMVAVALGALLLRRASRPSSVLAAALLVVLLADPLCVLAVDFWLSFGAVAVILYAAAGRLGAGWAARAGAWGRVQLAVTLALAPLTLSLFQQVSLIAPLANAWAIPWFGLVVVPLGLTTSALALIFPSIAGHLLAPVVWLAGLGLDGLRWMAELPFAEWRAPGPPPHAAALALAGTLLLVLPRGVPGRALGLVLWLPLVWCQPARPPDGHFRVTVLDVGQGMSAVVETAGRTLVYDLGPRLSEQFDATSVVVVPFLRERGVRRVDRLVLSNADSDHAGVPSALKSAVPVGDVRSGEPGGIHGVTAGPCVAGDEWTWDRVRFRFLHPDGARWEGNDRSCVLQVAAGEARLLLTGDIGSAVERLLVGRHGAGLQSLIVQVPHHGSRTSSSIALVTHARPAYALLSTGFRNRFGFPKPDVVDRWRSTGATVLDTQETGAISFFVGPRGIESGPELWRHLTRRYWRRR
jgi:competence protein ComEC